MFDHLAIADAVDADSGGFDLLSTCRDISDNERGGRVSGGLDPSLYDLVSLGDRLLCRDVEIREHVKTGLMSCPGALDVGWQTRSHILRDEVRDKDLAQGLELI